jgi:hypothetical protein
MTLQLSRFGDMPLQFVYSEIWHYNSSFAWNLPFYTYSMLLNSCAGFVIFVWTKMPCYKSTLHSLTCGSHMSSSSPILLQFLPIVFVLCSPRSGRPAELFPERAPRGRPADLLAEGAPRGRLADLLPEGVPHGRSADLPWWLADLPVRLAELAGEW